MPELNANIPPIECFVRGNFLRDQIDSHDQYFPCVVFGVATLPDRAPVFHFLMEDGGVWWRMPISAFCVEPKVPEVDIYDLVLWNSFSPFITVTQFDQMTGMRMRYQTRHKETVSGSYLFTLDWHTPESNLLDSGYSEVAGQHKCGHVIQRDDGNYAIQPNNRIKLLDPSFTTKVDANLIERQIGTRKYGVENADTWMTEDNNNFNYTIDFSPPPRH
jgi:hypothetical protein